MQRNKYSKFSTIFTLLLSAGISGNALAYDRIISATGNASEIIYELGLADKLIAVDTTSTLPEEVMAEKTKIGYRRRLSAEGILSMQADLLILAPDAGPPNVLEQIKIANIPTIVIKDEQNVAGVIADINTIAEKLNADGSKLIARIQDDASRVEQLIATYPRKPNIAFFMDSGMGKSQLTGLGKGSAGNAMIELIGGNNVFATQFSSLKPVSTEALIAAQPDIIFIAAHGGDFKAGAKTEQATDKYQKLSLSNAFKNKCIFRIGTVEALGFGPGFSQVAYNLASEVPHCLAQ